MKRKKISLLGYFKAMNKVMAKGLPVKDTLIALLNEHNKYDIKAEKK
jgi:hypothetical protein